MPNIDLSILNQRQTPAFYASSLATRPAFGFAGRIFIDTDSPSTGLYRDTGAAWVQIADPGAGTTGTLQQVTTNGNTTNQGISITAGGLSSNIVTISANGLGSTANYIGQTMANNDNWKIYGTGTIDDQGELVFQVGDNGVPTPTNGQRFRFSYDPVGGGGTAKDVLIIDYDLSYFNTSLGINTPTPGAAIDVHSSANIIGQLNQTTATNNSLLAFQNSGSGLWRIGNFYNSGANDLGIFDVIGNIQPVTVKKTTGQVLIGTSTVGSGKLVVASATGDNGIQIVGATAPSLRIDNAESGPTKRAGFGISTAVNNFIQGSVDRDFCMFNGSTTASPILFGIYGTTNVQEAARISAARNFLIGTTTDAGQKLQVNGTTFLSGSTTIRSSSTNQLTLDGGTTVQSRIVIARGSDDNAQGMTIGYSNITSYRTSTPLASPQTDFSLNQQGSDGTRTVLYMSSDGNIGINTLSPTSLFTVQGRGVSPLIMTLNSANPNCDIFMQSSVSANAVRLRNGADDFSVFTNGSQRTTVTSSGNLLIGTTTDNGSKLNVNGTAYISGNTGIGTVTPVTTLDVRGTNTATIRVGSSGNGGAGDEFGNLEFYWGDIDAAEVKAKIYTKNVGNVGPGGGGAANLIIATTPAYGSLTTRMTIKSTGVINISGIPTSAAGLVSGDIYSNAGILTIVP